MTLEHLCLIRGGGDLATGVAWRLSRAGFPVVVTELPEPMAVRRTVALSSAVVDRKVTIEGMVGRLARTADEAVHIAFSGAVGVAVSASLPPIGADVVVDARMAKRNLDTTIDDAPLVLALGPGFTAGVDCDAVIETMRGPRLGRVIWDGRAAPNTGSPGAIGGRESERVLRAPVDGVVEWETDIGSRVVAGQRLGEIAGHQLLAPFDGLVRGLIRRGQWVNQGTKIGDVDPRFDTRVDEISDKALAVGGGALEAVMAWSTQFR